LRHFITLAMIYVTRDCTCEKLIQDTLSLSEHGRKSVVEHVELQTAEREAEKVIIPHSLFWLEPAVTDKIRSKGSADNIKQ